jgi:hypothetical protein
MPGYADPDHAGRELAGLSDEARIDAEAADPADVKMVEAGELRRCAAWRSQADDTGGRLA